MIALGIETSCDETSCALVEDGRVILSNTVASSLRLHKKYKGVIPEIASRAHIEYISLVLAEALRNSAKKITDIDLVCVTKGPGLVGSLLVGISFAKALSFSLNKPLIGVNHLEAHLYASFLGKNRPSFPFAGLVVSGGHTGLFLADRNFHFKAIGSTSDDAAGEAFDKVAKILDAGYPGGPVIERMANKGDARRIRFSCNGPEGLDFSFSGIKTAVLYTVRNAQRKTPACPAGRQDANDIAAGFQKAVVNTLVEKSLLACRLHKINTLVVGGGVAANGYLRRRLTEEANAAKVKVYFPQNSLSLDNAAMIAGLGYQLFRQGKKSDYYLTVEI